MFGKGWTFLPLCVILKVSAACAKEYEMADNKRCWKIIYSRYEGLEKKALDLVSEELGSYINRDSGVYSLHVLPCERVEEAVIDCHAVILGVYRENPLLQKY